MGTRRPYAETGVMMADTHTHTREIANRAALVISPLARGDCRRCGTRIVFLHVRLCDHCLTDRLEEVGDDAMIRP
jgi:hypothetical protein